MVMVMQVMQDQDDDDSQAILALLYAILIKKKLRRRFYMHPLVKWLFRQAELRQLMGPNDRLAITNFVEIVWQYNDVQFQEDFRMPRQRFEVEIYLYTLIFSSCRYLIFTPI